jgi:hypothetical protein
MQAEINEEKLKKRRAARILLSEKRSKKPKTAADISAEDKYPEPNSEKDTMQIKTLSASKELQLVAIQWIKANRPAGLYRDWYPMLVNYWMSGKDPNFTGKLIPSYSTVYNWLQRHKDGPNSIQEIPAVPVAAIAAGVGGSPSLGDTVSDSGILSGVLAGALKHILKHLCEHDQYASIIRLSSISTKLWSLAKADVHYKQAANMRPGGDENVDALVRMLDFGCADGGLEMLAGASVQPPLLLTCGSSPALKLKFAALDKEMLCTIQSAASRRFLMKYCDGLHLVGTGTFGAVFILMKDSRSTGTAMKIFHRATTLEGAAKEGGKDAGALFYSRLLQKAKGASRVRSDISPFAPVAVDMGGTTGLVFFQDKDQKPYGYTALFMQEAVGTFSEEVQGLSALFRDKDGKVDASAFIILAVAMKSVLGAVKTMHATGMTHRDIKPDNIVMSSNLDQGGYVHRRTSDGKKVIAVMIDFGLAAFPGIYLVPQQHFAKFISKPLEAVAAGQEKGNKSVADSRMGTPRAKSMVLNANSTSAHKTILKANDEAMVGGQGGEPIHISESSLNRIAACVPSVGGDGIPPKERAGSYGTTVYGPPEKAPQPAAGMLHIPSGDWKPGDMWALGIIFAEILSGKPKSISLLAEHDKKIFAQTTDRVLWHTRLAKNMLPTSKEMADSGDLVPDEWQPAMDFLRGLTKYAPDERLTAGLAIQHPFIKLADRYRSDMSTTINITAKRARVLSENAAPPAAAPQ